MTIRSAAASLAAPLAAGVTAMLLPFLVLGAGATALPAGPVLCAGGGTGQTLAGIALSAEQMGNAQTITTVTAAKHLPAYAATIALATAKQESDLQNLDHGDRDSLGLFQQRPSQGWGTRAQLINPVYAMTAFLQRLVTVPDWQTIPLTRAAQAVQRSAFPDAYAHWQLLAQTLTAQLWPAAAANSASPAPGSTPVAPPPALCITGPGPPGSAGNPAVGTQAMPAGLVIDGSPAARTAVHFALAQLGKPYVWGAAGPDAYDCSGLTMAAWATAGIALPHHAADQATRGTPTTLANAAAGDLVFIAGADGTPQAPGHVGMIIGRTTDHHLYLIQAATEGVPIEVTDTSQWAGLIVAIRHIR